MYKRPNPVAQFMQTWRLELAAGGKCSAEVKIQRGIFQADVLSPLLFVIAMMAYNYILRKSPLDTNSENHKKISTTWCTWTESNFFLKPKKELKTLIQTLRIFSQYKGIEFAILVMKSVKRHITEGEELPNQVVIRTPEENETYKYLEILGIDTIKQVEIKGKKIFKCISEEPENYSRKTLWQEHCQRYNYLGCPPRKILGTILKVNQRRI